MRVDLLDDGPLHVGSHARLRQPRLPASVWEVISVIDGREFAWQSTSPGVTTIGRHEVVPEATGCRVTLSIEQTGPLGPVAALLLGRLTQRYVELEAESLDKCVTRATSA